MNNNSRLFNTTFHHYFDRNDNLYCYVSFNFKEFLKTYSIFSEIYDDENFNFNILDLLKFNFMLETTEGKLIKSENVEIIDIFDIPNIITFFSKFKNTEIPQHFFIKVVVNFKDGFYDYLVAISNNQIVNPLLTLPRGNINDFGKFLKLEYDKKFTNFYKPTNLNRDYEFISDYIKLIDRKVKVSNLFDIYSSKINYENYSTFLSIKEEEKKQLYDGKVPVTSYIKDKNLYYLKFNLKDKVGEIDKYLDLSLSLLNDLNNRKNYKELSFTNSIFIEEEKEKITKTLAQSETISALRSNSDQSKTIKIQKQDLLDSDMLYLITFLSNFDIIDINEYWANNIKIMPVYLLEILTNYNIYYLSNINEQSLYEDWRRLTKEELLQLNTGKYLCMIRPDKVYIQNSIIENYFVLEK